MAPFLLKVILKVEVILELYLTKMLSYNRYLLF